MLPFSHVIVSVDFFELREIKQGEMQVAEMSLLARAARYRSRLRPAVASIIDEECSAFGAGAHSLLCVDGGCGISVESSSLALLGETVLLCGILSQKYLMVSYSL